VEPGTLVLPAIVAVALVAVALAIGSILGSRQLRRRLLEANAVLEQTRVRVQGQAAELRTSLDQSTADADQVRIELERLGSLMEDMTNAMTQRRTGMEQMTRHRIGPAIRVLRLAGTAARIVYLWR
jgi:hypothetical protein